MSEQQHTPEPWAYSITRDGKQVGVERSLRGAQGWVDAEIVPLIPVRHEEGLSAELELENMMLRAAIRNDALAISFQSLAQYRTHLLSYRLPTEALSALIAKVERATIERCATVAGGQADGLSASVEIRALPTGQIKLEDL